MNLHLDSCQIKSSFKVFKYDRSINMIELYTNNGRGDEMSFQTFIIAKLDYIDSKKQR